jgi:hypothetical protein
MLNTSNKSKVETIGADYLNTASGVLPRNMGAILTIEEIFSLVISIIENAKENCQ